MKTAYLFLCLALFAVPAAAQSDCTRACDHPFIFPVSGNYSPFVLKGSSNVYRYGIYSVDVYTTITPLVTGLPAQVTSSLDTNDLGSEPEGHIGTRLFTSVTFTASSSVVVGHYSFPLSASSTGGTHMTSTIGLDVVSSILSISPGGQSVNKGSSLTYTLTLTGPGGSTATTPSCYIKDSPSTVTASVSGTVPASGGTATVTVATDQSAGSGDYLLLCGGSGTGVYILNAGAIVHVN